MNNYRPFLSILLIGFGLYFFLEQLGMSIALYVPFLPYSLLIFGLAFFVQSKKDPFQIFLAVICIGFGLHIFALHSFLFWPNHWAIYPLIIGIAFLIQFQKTKKKGMLAGIVLFLLAAAGLLFEPVSQMVNPLFGYIKQYWSLLFIALGLYFLIKK
ncbi:hypothetical protein [Massilibacterium senegalense]|uniref:hypothetical protein n=1 Tax=Massilibacterium senegalense TaxID=1632858 RepID=UPI00078042E0|nr:hypothetical protein [Massilibacterium senegalense]